jgi:hypothetical protein
LAVLEAVFFVFARAGAAGWVLIHVKARPNGLREACPSSREAKMTRLAALLWVMAGTVLAGGCVLVVLATPAMQADAMRFIPIAAIAGYVLGIPVAIAAAKAISHGAA